MAEQLKIVVGRMPTWSVYQYRVMLVDCLGTVRDKREYRLAGNALRCIERWQTEHGAAIEESELGKIPIE